MPTRRTTELLLVLAAVLIAVFGYVEVGVNLDGRVPADAAEYGAALGVLALLAHVVVRRRARYADPLLLPIAVLLNGIGLVVIYRLDRATSGVGAASTQLLWSSLGVALFIAVVLLVRDHRRLQRYAYLGALVALVLLVLPIFFPPVYGSRIWIVVGPLSFQPGSSPRSCWPSSSPPTWRCTGTRWRSPAAGSGAGSCPAAGCSGRCC